MQRATVFLVALLAAATLSAQRALPTAAVPRLWTQAALAGWALPIAGVNATPNFYTEEEYYAAPVDEVLTYPFYVKGREPAGYRESLRRRGPRPLIDASTLKTEADWLAAGRIAFDGMHLREFRTASPAAMAWADDPDLAAHQQVSVARDGTVPGVRWVVDHDGILKLTLSECSGCHRRLLPDGSVADGAQTNVRLGSLPVACFDADAAASRLTGRDVPPNESSYEAYGVPWLKDDINVRLKTMTKAEIDRVDGQPFLGTFVRFNASPWITTKIVDLIGVKDRKYLDATATHRNRGPEDIARYGVLVTTADDGSLGPHHFMPENRRQIRWRNSDEAMLALGKYIYSLQPPSNPNRPSGETARGERVFTRSGCAGCHAPPLYTNNKLVPAEGFERFEHANAPPAGDVMNVKLGLDPGLALRTRKGTGYYKVPSLKGVWYRGPLEHSGSIATLEEWFDPARLRADYAPKGWNPPDVTTRAIPGHPFGLNLNADDKRALIAFLRTL
jgi:hypothetical protein